MKEILNRLFNHEQLSTEEAYNTLTSITQEKFPFAQVAAFLGVFNMRGISVEELSGFRNALVDLCRSVDLEGREVIDVCGTGGDGKNTFNISTLSAFVVAGAGYQVAKHGNKSVSSNCGSSDVLQNLGYTFSNDQSILLRQLDEANICFMHAPLFHPALKSVGGIRKDLGTKTFFNMLGPLVNPVQPSHQLVGVFNLKVMRLYHAIMNQMGHEYTIVHGLDGFDEISLTCDTKVISKKSGTFILKAADINMPSYHLQDIFGGHSIKEATDIFLNILNNRAPKSHIDVVIANSALAIDCFKDEFNLSECISEARESLESGKALRCFEKSVELSNC